MAATMGLVEPMMTGIGGDVFILYFDAKTGKVSGFNGSGKSSASASLADAKAASDGKGHIQPQSGLSVNVPGAAAGWWDILENWGSGRLSMLEILQPAIDLAKDGFPVSDISANLWQDSEKKLKTASPNGGELLIDGKAPVEGQLFTNPYLAEVYEQVARYGKDGFYTGKIAEAIVESVKEAGGKLTLDDLKNHKSLKLDPVSLEIADGVTLHELPPNNHGLVALIAAGIVKQLEKDGKLSLAKDQHNSVEYIHAIAESLKFAFKDADHYIGDPEQLDFDIKSLVADKYIESRAQLFDPSRPAQGYNHGVIDPVNSSDTSYFTVADKEGNACSIIASIYHGFGSGIVPKNCGFTLHNRGCNFNLEEGSRNAFAGDKRPYHTIIPAMLTKGDKLYASYGVMGAFMQPQGHLQVALNLIKFGLDPQAALDAPRICIAPAKNLADIPADDIVILLEEGIPSKVATGLEALGHEVRIISGYARAVFGRGQIIQFDPQNGKLVYHAGSDPRGDGSAIPEI